MRLDARLLQLLKLAAGFMRHDPAASDKRLSIRQFAVTPINHAVGLIEWIGNTSPIFAVYSNWQKLQAARPSGESRNFSIQRIHCIKEQQALLLG